eukprot:COSAG05_NODE_348_length_10944_cov_10.258368_3_plen_77_part_00
MSAIERASERLLLGIGDQEEEAEVAVLSSHLLGLVADDDDEGGDDGDLGVAFTPDDGGGEEHGGIEIEDDTKFDEV